MLVFAPFRLDLDDERLWKDDMVVTLRRKPFAVLRYLAQHPHRLVTHDELLRGVWGPVKLSESAVRSQLHELRQVVGEGVIETVPGRGYRFIAQLSEVLPRATNATTIVGRDDELVELRAIFEGVRAGRQALVFVSGEAGVGKTTLVDAFCTEVNGPLAIVGRGQCVEQYGAPEAYLAVREAIAQLCQSDQRARVLASLSRHAPTFLLEMPNLASAAQLDELRQRGAGGNQARMLRELVESCEAISLEIPVVIVLEDLQWSDVATLDLLALLARRRERSRILVLATARRSELQTTSNPLNRVVRELVARDGAVLLAVEPMTARGVQRYLDRRFAGHRFPAELAAIVHQVTGGIPLFLVALLDELLEQRAIVEREGAWVVERTPAQLATYQPASVRQLIELQLDRLASDEQRMLEVAGLLGARISTPLLAAALDAAPEHVEELCMGLDRRGLFLQRADADSWPDGAHVPTYVWKHGLVQQICLERAPPSRQQRWHRTVAERLELAYGERRDEIASVLAAHFERAQQPERAASYFTIAAERTVRMFATSDAVDLYRRAFRSAQRIADGPVRDRLELRLLPGYLMEDVKLGGEALVHADRLVELATRYHDDQALRSGTLMRALRCGGEADYPSAIAIVDELIAQGPSDPATEMLAHVVRLAAHLHRGEFAAAERTYAHIVVVSTRQTLEHEAAIVAMMYDSLRSWLIGCPERALADARAMLVRADAARSPTLSMLAQLAIARMHYLRRDPAGDTIAAAVLVLDNPIDDRSSHDEAAMLIRAVGGRVERDAIQPPRIGASVMPTVAIGRTVTALAALDVLRRSQHHEQAERLVDELLEFATRHDERVVESELLCQRGRILADRDREAAVGAFQAAITSARAIGALTLELRATTQLARLVPAAEGAPWRARLAALIAQHSEGHDTHDVRDARALIR